MKKQLIALSLLLAGILSACSPKSEPTLPPSTGFIGMWKVDFFMNSGGFTSADGSQYVDNIPAATGFSFLNIRSDFNVSFTSSDLGYSDSDIIMENFAKLVRIDDSNASLILNPELPQTSNEPVVLKIKSATNLTLVVNKMEMNLSRLSDEAAKDLFQRSNEYRQYAQGQKAMLKTHLAGKKFLLVEKKTQFTIDGKESSYSEDISKLEDEHQYPDHLSVNAKRIAFAENLSQATVNEKWDERAIVSSLQDKSGVIMTLDRSIGKDTTTSDLRGKLTLFTDGFTITSDSTYTDKDHHVTRTISTSKYILAK